MIYAKGILIINKNDVPEENLPVDRHIVAATGFPLCAKAYYIVVYNDVTVKIIKNRFYRTVAEIPLKVWEEIHKLIALDVSLNK